MVAIPLLIERGVEGVASRAEQRTGALLRGGVRIRKDVEGGDADERGAVAARDPLPGRDRDAQPGERSGADRDGDAIDGRERCSCREERALDRGKELVALPPLRVPRFLGEDVAAVEERDRRPVGRRVKR